MKKLIVIADWASDTLTCQEFKSAVEGFLKDPKFSNINFVHSTPSTIHAGFICSQIVETEERYGRPLETVIFLNVDPRLQGRGASLIVLQLKSGIYLLGPNAGYNFSFIKEKINQAFAYQGFNHGSQFRSRDFYSRVCAHLMDEMEDELELEQVTFDNVPSLQGYYIGHIDNFGNVKTTIKLSEFKGKYQYGDTVVIKIKNVEKKTKFVKGLFAGQVGDLIIYPGSSGPKEDPYLEISVWRYFTEKNQTTGCSEFNNPLPGEIVQIISRRFI